MVTGSRRSSVRPYSWPSPYKRTPHFARKPNTRPGTWPWSSIRDLLGPKPSDRAELTLDRLRDTPELRSDLGVGVPFHLPPRHRAQRVIAQAAIEPPAFLGHLDRQLGGGLGIEDLF